MALDLGPLKAVVQDLERAAENVGVDLVKQESGIAQEDLDGLTSALQGVHQKLTSAGSAPAPGVATGPVPADPAAAGAGGTSPEPPAPASATPTWTPEQPAG